MFPDASAALALRRKYLWANENQEKFSQGFPPEMSSVHQNYIKIFVAFGNCDEVVYSPKTNKLKKTAASETGTRLKTGYDSTTFQ